MTAHELRRDSEGTNIDLLAESVFDWLSLRGSRCECVDRFCGASIAGPLAVNPGPTFSDERRQAGHKRAHCKK
jgi:hypothetical protein